MTSPPAPTIAIACGGTGGHLFPGLAVAEQLVTRDCAVSLLVSPKEVDQQAVKRVSGMDIVTLPAVGLTRGGVTAFVRGFLRSYRAARQHFAHQPPQAVLTMGGFTGAAPLLAARRHGARTFIHESNTIPGRANRWLSRVADQVFVGFSQAGSRLHNRNITCTGTPVRPRFKTSDAIACRLALGLQPARPVLLIMGGSQGASGINELLSRSLPLLAREIPQLQLIVLAGARDEERIRAACAAHNLSALVHSSFADMDQALGAADAAISRAGASSLAELAAIGVPCVLIPYPSATDNHQFYNARAFEQTGAALLLEQSSATPEKLVKAVSRLIGDSAFAAAMRAELSQWHRPQAAENIAESILDTLSRRAANPVPLIKTQRSVGASERPPADSERHSLSTA